jgi:enoyl-CoA hydratase
VNRSFTDKETMLHEVMKITETIAAKSPFQCSRGDELLLHTRDHSVADGLSTSQLGTPQCCSNDLGNFRR